MESLSRRRDSGLLYTWDNWQKSLYLMKSKLILGVVKDQFPESNFQVVQSSHLVSLGLLCPAVSSWGATNFHFGVLQLL